MLMTLQYKDPIWEKPVTSCVTMQGNQARCVGQTAMQILQISLVYTILIQYKYQGKEISMFVFIVSTGHF